MRALAGPAMMLVMTIGFVAYRMSSKEEAPSRDFLELEFAGADAEHTGSCYSLSTVLIANRFGGGEARTWTTTREEEWTLLLDDVVQGNGGPVRDYQKFTFEKHGALVRLVAVETSPNRDSDLHRNIDELVDGPKALGSTPVDRCLDPSATGYRFVPRR
jgi:hypothetical protein